MLTLPFATSARAAGQTAIIAGPGHAEAAGDYDVDGLPREGEYVFAADGAAAGTFDFFGLTNDSGIRAVRWSAAGFVELGTLGTAGADAARFAVTSARAMNAAGDVVGLSTVFSDAPTGFADLGYRAVRWDATSAVATQLADLGTDSKGNTASTATGVNAAGTTVGWAARWSNADAYLGAQAVRWDAHTTSVTALGTLGQAASGASGSMASAINDAGTIVGTANRYRPDGTSEGPRPVRWDAGSTVATELDNIGLVDHGTNDVGPAAINAAGTAVGSLQKSDIDGNNLGPRAVRWDAGGTAVTELPTLGTDADESTSSEAFAINRAGVSVGRASKFDAAGRQLGERAVRWDVAGNITELPLLGQTADGVSSAEAFTINASGTVAGYSDSVDAAGMLNGSRAVLWRADGSLLDLDALLADHGNWTTLTEASGVSDAGWVSGLGEYDPDGAGRQQAYTRAFLMLVPEAGTYGQGDANFDTHVDFADLLVLAKHYDQSSNGATDAGDLDLNGVTDFNDLLTLAKHYGTSPASVLSANGDAAFANDWALAQSLVPEPGSLAMAVSLIAGGARSRRRSATSRPTRGA